MKSLSAELPLAPGMFPLGPGAARPAPAGLMPGTVHKIQSTIRSSQLRQAAQSRDQVLHFHGAGVVGGHDLSLQTLVCPTDPSTILYSPMTTHSMPSPQDLWSESLSGQDMNLS